MALTDKQLEEFRTKHGDIEHCKGKAKKDGTIPWEVVLKFPGRAAYKRFRTETNQVSQRADAQERLVRSSIVYPELTAFDALLERYPGICESKAVDQALNRLTGLASEEGEG